MGVVNPDVYEAGSDQARVMALTDGVFAIVITLLVLEIQVPELAGDSRTDRRFGPWSLEVTVEHVRESFVGAVP